MASVPAYPLRSDRPSVQQSDRQRWRWKLQECLWRRSSLPRVRACRNRRLGTVRVHADGGSGHFSGLATCGSVWACPQCSAKVRSARAGQLLEAERVHVSGGGTVAMVTLTVPHDLGQSLDVVLGVVVAAWRDMMGGRAWRERRRDLGIEHWFRSVEVTVGEHGWHPHLHVLVFGSATADYVGLLDLWAAQWCDLVVAAGLRRPTQFDLRVGEAGAYVSKLQEPAELDRASMEVCRGDLKSGRRHGRAPFEVLADLNEWGDVGDLALWREYEAATKGRRAMTCSRGFRQRYLAGTDDELAAAEVGGEVVLELTGPEWTAVVRTRGAVWRLLFLARVGGPVAARAWVDVCCLPYRGRGWLPPVRAA